jgi:hypothetical protein
MKNRHLNIRHCNTDLKLKLTHSLPLKLIGETQRINLKCVLFINKKCFKNSIDLGDWGRKHFFCSQQNF